MTMFPVRVKRLTVMSQTIHPRPVVTYVASIDGVPIQFRGRTHAEALGLAVLHLIGKLDPDAEQANAEGGVN